VQLFLIIKQQVGELQKRRGVCRARSMEALKKQFRTSPRICQCPSAVLDAQPHPMYHLLCRESSERCWARRQEVYGCTVMRGITISHTDFRRNERQGCNSLCLELPRCSNGVLETLPLDKVCGGGDLGTDVAAVG